MTKLNKVDPERIEKIENKLKASLDELQIEIDQNRFEQELIYYIEKLDINEEKVRLSNHIEYFTNTMDNPSSSGKKIRFYRSRDGQRNQYYWFKSQPCRFTENCHPNER